MSTAVIPVPQAVEEMGVPRNLLEDLALKILFLAGELTLREFAERLQVSIGVMEEIFQRLRQEQLLEVKGITGTVYRMVATDRGKSRALDLLSLNQYAGAAPVSFHEYVKRVRTQSVRDAHVHPPDLKRAFQHMVLSEQTLRQLGTAIVSGTSIFLHGPAGTGKTAVAETIPSIYHDSVWIPHAVEIDNQIITVYDAVLHHPVDTSTGKETDGRWVLCRRPRVVVGGELTIEMLDLQFNPVTKFYAAPLQMKANNGVLIVDDFGRQRISPEELLNRWIVPLDRKIDFLTLVGGKKFEVPFDMFVIFATNLDPTKLADEAFLRRIQSKVKLGHVTAEQFHEIFRLVCRQFRLNYDAEMVDHLINMLFKELNQPLRPCYPRDIIQQILWAARYEGKEPRLDRATITQACRNYFLAP